MPEIVSLCKGPKQAYEAFADKGAELSRKPIPKIFHQAVLAGVYKGFGGMLCLTVAGGIAHASKDNPTLQNFVFAALLPVNLFLTLSTGGVLFTGASATVPAAVYEKKAHWSSIPKIIAISWVGNLVGAVILALSVHYCDLNIGGTAELAKEITYNKCSKDFVITFIKGVGCNWLVCMAVFLSGQAQDMAGKMVGIWFPISCFVAIGFEHTPANMFILTMGLLAGADLSVWDIFITNIVPATMGNFFAGAVCVAFGYSYAFGSVGSNNKSIIPVTRCSQEDKGERLAENDFGLEAALASVPDPAKKEPKEGKSGSDLPDPAGGTEYITEHV